MSYFTNNMISTDGKDPNAAVFIQRQHALRASWAGVSRGSWDSVAPLPAPSI